MRKLTPQTRKEIAKLEDQLVEKAQKIAQSLWDEMNTAQRRDGKARQLRNILEVAEGTDSWKALELFIRYQAARREIPKSWAEFAIRELDTLQQDAQSIAQRTGDEAKGIHLELVTRALGHAVRWHLWDKEKSKTEQREER